MDAWSHVLTLDSSHTMVSGSPEALCDAIRCGADLRIATDFYHHEHIIPGAAQRDIIHEVSEFRVTYLVDDRWTAGIMSLRQPIMPPVAFGPRPSMSFFLYNQDGRQAIARPFLDGVPPAGLPGPSPLDDHRDMPKYHQFDAWDSDTNAPSQNFIYDFEQFQYFVNHRWQEVLAHDADGQIYAGSFTALADAFRAGCEVKVAIRDLCADLDSGLTHEVFVQTCTGYLYPERGYFSAETQPIVRVAPAIPLAYHSDGWDFGWAIACTDGTVALLCCNPYTLQFSRQERRAAMRWFISA
ncbi:MAG: hypothetical protein ACYDBB_09085 [Armatimonadota bacterium]